MLGCVRDRRSIYTPQTTLTFVTSWRNKMIAHLTTCYTSYNASFSLIKALLRKSIITARQATSTSQQDLAVIQYIFTDGVQEVTVNSHGNCKGTGSRAFKRGLIQKNMVFCKTTLWNSFGTRTLHSDFKNEYFEVICHNS